MLPSSGVTEQESFPAKFSNYLPWLFLHVVSFLIICLESSFLESCSHANQELKNQNPHHTDVIGWALCQFRQDHNGKKKNPNPQLFALIQVQLFSFTCKKKSDNFLCPYKRSNSWSHLKFYYQKKRHLKSKAGCHCFPLFLSKCKFWIHPYALKEVVNLKMKFKIRERKRSTEVLRKTTTKTIADLEMADILRSE